MPGKPYRLFEKKNEGEMHHSSLGREMWKTRTGHMVPLTTEKA